MEQPPPHRDDELPNSQLRSKENWKSTSFLGLVLTQFFGAFNDNLFRWLAVPIAQPVLGNVASVALGGLCLTLPFLFLMPVAGWLADRYSKRNVINACKVAELVLMMLGVLAILYGSITSLFGIVFLMGVQSALFGPAKFGSIPEMLPSSLLSKGNGIMAMFSIVAIGLGTVAGFVIYDLTGPVLGSGNWSTAWPSAAALIGIALAGLFTSLPVRTGPPADPTRKPTLNPLLDVIPAIRLLKADRRLLRTALGIAFFYFLASLAQQNIDPFGETTLGLGKTDIGILLGTLIAGVAAGSLLAGVWSEGKVELGIVPLGALGISCSALLVFIAGSQMNFDLPAKSQFAYWGSSIGLFLLGASAGLYDVPLEAYLQFRSEEKTRGTVLAGSYFITYVLIVLSFGIFYLLGTVLALSPAAIFMVASLMTLPVVFYTVWLMPDWTFRFCMWLATHSIYRLRVHNIENIPDRGGALIVANHVSFLDGVMLCISSSRFIRFLVYSDFTEMPLLRVLAKFMRVIPIRAEDGPIAVVKSINTAREALKNGEVVCIFAEGGLTRTGQIQPFQRGLLKIIRGIDVPVIPTYLHGLWGSIFSWRGGKVFWKWPRKWPLPVDVHFGDPLHNPQDVAVVRQAVEHLGAEAVKMDASQNQVIPARQFIRHCKASKFVPKICDSTKAELTGGKLLAATLAMRRVLNRIALQRGEKHVGVLLPPSVGGCLANMALAVDSRVAVNLNYTLSEEVLNFCVKKAQLKHVITSRKFLEKKPFNLEGATFIYLEDVKEQVTSLDRLIGAAEAYCVPARILDMWLGLNRIHPDETLTIVFTSGSTGEPKGVVLSQANIGSNVEAIDHLLNLQHTDGVLGVLPFFHSFGYTACMWLPMCYNVRGVYHFNPLDAKVVGRLCQENKITIMMATPTFLKMYMKRCEPEQFKTVDLIVVGAEKLPVDLAKQFEEKFKVLPTEGYGTTELSPVAAVNIPDHRSRTVYQQGTKLGTVGRPLPGVTAKIVDPDTGADRGIGVEGLLLIKGPNVMRGYLDEPAKTSELIHDGWYNTGDFGMLDQDGFLTITGRQSRFSKIGGEMVPHIRIEQELFKICESPEDEEGMIPLAVTAVPDEDRGERLIVLYTQLCKPVEQIIKELAQTGLPKLWLPSADSFIPVEQIPILGTGKLDLRAVKELALQATCPATTSP
ncbi:acyl-[ACP]--phospholipid O-acyltransferase [Planctomicrobium sp. SH661]|uniref:acyl-[ACP]--phospholipid O-acyltransferase n=1 Tax=Planctomicrobium sp. SH661 TaxID=3448124 RepID=UPI003F5C3483